MKTLVMIFACLQAMHVSARATDDLPISFEQLPAQSQQLIKEHFSGQAIALVKMDTDILDKSYEVIFTNGNKIEFDRKGNWKEINCKHSQCPQKLIPAAIWNYVEKHFAGNKICKIEKEDWNGYEVGLSNGISLEFDSGFRLVDIDD